MMKKILEKLKNKKERVFIFSLINHYLLNLYQDVDILRFDINEFAILNGNKDEKSISYQDIIPVLRNFNKLNKVLMVDLPLVEIYGKNTYNLEKIINFYRNTYADILSLNIDYDIIPLIKKLNEINIPSVVYSINKTDERELDFQHLIHRFHEAEANNVLFLILENYSSKYINEIKKHLSLSVITNNKSKAGGYYAKFSSVFGLLPDGADNKYLNLYDLIKEGIQDCLFDNK